MTELLNGWPHSPFVLYVALVVLVGGYSLVRVTLWLGTTERLRIRRLKRHRSLESVPTESPVDDALSVARERGVRSIERQATVIRRLTLPLLGLAFVALILMPFLSRVPATAVTLIAAAITVVLGIAARPVIENAISGLVIAFSKLINIGDTVMVDEHYGTVEDITITHTTIKLWDWRRYVVPNSRMIAASLLNYSVFDGYFWTCTEFWVSYDTDIEQVRSIALSIPSRSKYYAGHEEPAFWLMDLQQKGFRCWIAAWADSPADGWMLKHDIRTELIREFRQAGIATHLQQHAVRDLTNPSSDHRPQGSPR